MTLLGARKHTILRQAPGTYDADGIWRDGIATTFQVRASMQPMSGRDLERLPEGYRQRGAARLFAPIAPPLEPADVAGARCDRLVDAQGREWDVVTVLDWAAHAAPTRHREYLLSLRGEDRHP